MTQISEQPLYMRLVESLLEAVREGRFPPGTRLPSEGDLCRQFSVSRHTVREALRRLADDGLVQSRKGSGTVVIGPDERRDYVHQIASIEDLVEYAADVPLRILNCRMVTAGPALARKLDCPEGVSWCFVTGMRHLAGQAAPVCWTEVYLNEVFADYRNEINGKNGPPYPIYKWIESRYRVDIAQIEQVMTVRAIPARIAQKLGWKPDQMGVEVRRIFRLESGVIAEIAVNIHPASTFRYSLTLKCRSGRPAAPAVVNRPRTS